MAVAAGLLEVFIALKNEGEFQIEAIRAVASSADNGTGWVVQVNGLVFMSRR